MPKTSGSFMAVHPPKLSHADYRDYLGLALDGGIGTDTQQRVDRHLARCRSCRAFGPSLQATVQAVRELPKESAPVEVRQRLLSLMKD